MYTVYNQVLSENIPSGIEMILDIGIVDVTTCQPMPNVMVEVWSCKYAVGRIQNFLIYLRPL